MRKTKAVPNSLCLDVESNARMVLNHYYKNDCQQHWFSDGFTKIDIVKIAMAIL